MPNLQEPILDPENGVRNIHFFNGRLLTGEDLRDEQTANARRHAALARAVGAGIVTGLEVTLKAKSPAAATVTAGCAINRLGQVLDLLADTDVSLTTAAAGSAAVTTGDVFSACPQTASDAGREDFTGAFLLVMGPVFSYSGQAPKHETYNAGTASGCGTAYEIQGVEFRLIELKLQDLSENMQTQETIQALTAATAVADRSKLRNLLAHACFGTEDLARFALEPFAGSSDSSFNRYGAVDRLRDDGRLDDCSVPLALTYWNDEGLQLIDQWPVRRLVFLNEESPWAPFLSRRRVAEGQAIFQQFQIHLHDLLKTSSILPAAVTAKDYFRYLPPAGLLPIRAGPGTVGFDLVQFFSGLTVPEPVTIEGRQLRPLLESSYRYGASDLESLEFHWLYQVRETQAGAPDPQPYIVFANGLLPYQGDTHERARVILQPIPDPVRVGDEITVLGAGFRVPARLNELFIDDTQVAAFNPGTSATRFVFNVPELPDLERPRFALLRLQNANGSASTPITVIPAPEQVPDGVVLVNLVSTGIGAVEPGAGLTLEFQVDSQTNIAESYVLTALYANVVGASEGAWLTATTLNDVTGTAISQIRVSPGEPAIVRLAVTVPDDAESADLSLRAASVNNPSAPLLTVNSSPLTLVVGSEAQTSDPRVQFERFEAAAPAEAINDPLLGQVLQTPPATDVLLQITANFDEPGIYTYLASILGGPIGDWIVQVVAPASGQSVETGPNGEQQITLRLTAPPSDPSSSRTLEIRATREADAASGQDRIESWFRIPVRIVG